MGQGYSMKKMEDTLFEMKFTAKQLNRQAQKSQKEEKGEKEKLRKALAQGNVDGARIYAENAIRKKNESLNYLRLSSRVDAVASKLDSAVRMSQVNENMAKMTNSLGGVLKSMDLDKISKVMTKFEQQFEDMDVQTQYVEQSIASSTAITTPEDEVSKLIMEVADANNMEIAEELGTVGNKVPSAEKEPANADDLSQRFAKLKEK